MNYHFNQYMDIELGLYFAGRVSVIVSMLVDIPCLRVIGYKLESSE